MTFGHLHGEMMFGCVFGHLHGGMTFGSVLAVYIEKGCLAYWSSIYSAGDQNDALKCFWPSTWRNYVWISFCTPTWRNDIWPSGAPCKKSKRVDRNLLFGGILKHDNHAWWQFIYLF